MLFIFYRLYTGAARQCLYLHILFKEMYDRGIDDVHLWGKAFMIQWHAFIINVIYLLSHWAVEYSAHTHTHTHNIRVQSLEKRVCRTTLVFYWLNDYLTQRRMMTNVCEDKELLALSSSKWKVDFSKTCVLEFWLYFHLYGGHK